MAMLHEQRKPIRKREGEKRIGGSGERGVASKNLRRSTARWRNVFAATSAEARLNLFFEHWAARYNVIIPEIYVYVH